MIFQFSIQPKEINENSKQLYFQVKEGEDLDGFPLISIGRDSYIVSAKNENGLNVNNGYVYNLQIGKFCAIAHDVNFIIDINHDYSKVALGFSDLLGNRDFCEKFKEDKDKGIILFLKNDINIIDNYNKIEKLVENIDAKCDIFVHCGEIDDVHSIFSYADYYITNRSKDTVYHSCLADLNGLKLISGVDIPIF